MYWFNLFRQVRNPDASGLVFPTQAEFFEIYQLIDQERDVQWPVTGAGENEGANLGNPMMQFVYGLSPSLSSEEDRLSDPEGIPLRLTGDAPSTLAEFWELGKAQRGAVTVNGLQNAPAFTAAQSHFQIVTPTFSPHGKAYGGFFPTPVELGVCGTTEETGLTIPNYQIKFTNLDSGAVETYTGSCPVGTDNAAAGHVQGIIQTPFSYYVFVYDGTNIGLDIYPVDEWIQGPYTGQGVLARYDGEQLNRVVWKFTSEYRGSDDQRDEKTFKVKNVAFDFQEFLTRQYALAPNLAVVEGGALVAKYPTITKTGVTKINLGTFLNFSSGSIHHFYTNGFVLSGFFAKATGLFAATVLDVFNGSELIGSITLEPDGTGYAENMVWLKTPVAPSPLKVQCREEVLFTSTAGTLRFEATELFEYKPNYYDAYLVARMCSTDGEDLHASGGDTRGIDWDFSKETWENYRDYGCIINQNGAIGLRQQAEWVTDNSVFDAARRATREQMRILARRQFVSYEVSGGKSILRFKRYAYGMDNAKADCFYGIAPSYTPIDSGNLEQGETYTVRTTTGTVTYLGATYSNGQRFAATAQSNEFQAHGDAQLFVYDGIRSTARKTAWTNEWVMFIQTKCYHVSESSIWKPAAYSDYFAWNQRCHFYSGSATDSRFRRHVTYNYSVDVLERDDGSGYDSFLNHPNTQAQYVAPESPSGYNYATGNFAGVTTDFYKSCQIYQKPYELESATVEFVGAEEIVKLTFTERFLSEASAPATVNQDATTWSAGEVTNLQAEDYRTDDNALRDYARSQVDAGYQCPFRIGDSGTNSIVSFLPDNPFGSCYPHFFFCKLLPKPYADGNDIREPHDTRTLAESLFHADCLLKSGCEGFVDGQTSIQITCETGNGSLYDYTFENLCFDAFGGRWISPLPESVRTDDPAGYGPLPNTKLYAAVFNKVSACVNLLTKARVFLPFTVECKSDGYTGEQQISQQWPSATQSCWTDAGGYKIAYSGVGPPAGTLTSPGAFADCGGGAAGQSNSFIDVNSCPVEGGPQFFLRTDRVVTEYRVAVDADALNAIPSEWRNSVNTIGGFIGIRNNFSGAAYAESTTISGETDACGAGNFWFDATDGTGWKNIGEVTIVDEDECVLLTAGTLDPGSPVGGVFVAGHDNIDPPNRCNNDSQKQVSVEVLTEPGFFIEVPVV